jgi:hypothetical protein
MKKECVVSRIEASQDGSPYVYVTFSDPNDYKPGAERPQNPFGMNMMAFTSPEDFDGIYVARGFDEKFAKGYRKHV